MTPPPINGIIFYKLWGGVTTSEQVILKETVFTLHLSVMSNILQPPLPPLSHLVTKSFTPSPFDAWRHLWWPHSMRLIQPLSQWKLSWKRDLTQKNEKNSDQVFFLLQMSLTSCCFTFTNENRGKGGSIVLKQNGVHMKRQKNAIVIIIKNSQMVVTSTKFWNFFNLEKIFVRKVENFEKLYLLF